MQDTVPKERDSTGNPRGLQRASLQGSPLLRLCKHVWRKMSCSWKRATQTLQGRKEQPPALAGLGTEPVPPVRPGKAHYPRAFVWCTRATWGLQPGARLTAKQHPTPLRHPIVSNKLACIPEEN